MDIDAVNPRRRVEIRTVAAQAAEWLLALEDDDPKVRAAFSDWIAESPLHVAAFLRAATVDSLLDRIDPERSIQIDRQAMKADGVDIAPQNNDFMPSSRHDDFPSQRVMGASRLWFAAAGIVLVAATSVFLLHSHLLLNGRWTHYNTTIGEQRVFELDDGSVLYMNTGSKVDVLFQAHERQIRLREGEAMFRVHHDPSRPFRVYSGSSVIQALGTQFNVNHTRDDSVVSVIEGSVQVSHDHTLLDSLTAPIHDANQPRAQPIRLTAGQQLRISRSGGVAAPTPADISRVSAWRQRRLIFIDEPLLSIAAEFNRYNRSPKIHIEGTAVGARRYAAAFDADDPESLFTILKKDPTLQIEQRPDELIVRSR